MSQFILRVLPITPGTDVRGAPLGVVPCPTHWPDGVHGFHHCQHMITKYAAKAPLTDGWVQDEHDGDHVCACGSMQAPH